MKINFIVANITLRITFFFIVNNHQKTTVKFTLQPREDFAVVTDIFFKITLQESYFWHLLHYNQNNNIFRKYYVTNKSF